MITRRALLYSTLSTAAASTITPPSLLAAAMQFGEPHQPPWRQPVSSSQTITIDSARLQVDFAPGALDLPHDAIILWITRAARAVTGYYGRFPVPATRILVQPTSGSGVHGGTTWGNVGGSPTFTRIHVGEHTTSSQLNDDWMMTHELIHAALASLPDQNHWLEEGTAVYIEPIARVQAGQLSQQQVWHDMIRDMPQGQPHDGDLGLDNTHTWGRTYWGGAGFCLLADIELRKRTLNRFGLQQALRAVLAAGGNISQNWEILPTLQIADKATGTQVLTTLYKSMSDKPVPIDFASLWQQLGVSPANGTVSFDSKAPLASIRQAIFSPAT
jgi:hypothetical protein